MVTSIRRTLARVVPLLVCLVFALPQPGPASALLASSGGTSTSHTVEITVAGHGDYFVHQHASANGGSCEWYDEYKLTWQMSYELQDNNDALQGGAPSDATPVGTQTQLVVTPGGMATCPGGCFYSQTGTGDQQFDSDGAAAPHVQINPLDSLTGSGCGPETAGFWGSDLTVLDANLPGIMTNVAQIPAADIASGAQDSTIALDSSASPSQPMANCLGYGRHGSGVDECDITGSWSATMAIHVPVCDKSQAVAKVTGLKNATTTNGQAIAYGDPICGNQPIKTGPGGSITIEFQDGSTVRVGPNSDWEVGETDFTDSSHITVKDELQHVFSQVSHALGGDDVYEHTTERAAVGVRGSAMTEDAMSGGKILYHVTEGTGFVQLAGKPRISYPAGLSLICTTRSCVTTVAWPAADRVLVPAADLPPSLGKARLSGTRGTPAMKLSFNAGAKGAGTVQVLHGPRVLSTKRFTAPKGAGSIKPLKRRLTKGAYVLRLFLADSTGRTSAVDVPLKVTRSSR